jgi:glycosyltransferase involved in cell wall biosynthesis
MSTSPLVSIILPVYNGAKYLEFAIRGVLQQTYQNFELIIVNDCSTDTTLSIAESFQKQDPRIRIVNNKINLKLPSSLNAGFDSAKGDLFTWTSDDNIHHPNFLEELLNQLKNHNADLVYSDVNIINQDGELKFHNKMGSPEELVYHNSIGASFL